MDEYYGSYPVGPSRKQVILRLAIGAAALLILGAIIIWLIFFHNKSPNVTSKVGKVETSQQHSQSAEKKSTNSGSSQTKNQPSANSPNTATKAPSTTSGSSANKSATGSSSTASNSGSASAKSGSATSTSTATGESSDLSETGPGGIIGLFALTFILTASFRRWQLSRR